MMAGAAIEAFLSSIEKCSLIYFLISNINDIIFCNIVFSRFGPGVA